MKIIRWSSCCYNFVSYPKLEDMSELLSKQNLTLKRIAYNEKKFLQVIRLEFSDGLISPIISSDKTEASLKKPKYFEFDQN